MSAPTLILLAGSHHQWSAIQRISAALNERRPDLPVEILDVSTDPECLVRHLKGRETAEVVCVPMTASTMSVDDASWQAVVTARAAHPSATIGLTPPLGACDSLFGAVDRSLAAALRGQNHLEMLILWHDGAPESVDLLQLRRQIRAWGRRHRLPVVPCALGDSNADLKQTWRHLKSKGIRRLAIGTLAIDVDPARVDAVREWPGVVAVGEPLGHDPVIIDRILSHYGKEAMARTVEAHSASEEAHPFRSDLEVSDWPVDVHSFQVLEEDSGHCKVSVPLPV